MNTLKSLLLLFGIICAAYSTVPCKKICILDNVKCVTKGGFTVFKNVVNGVKGFLKPLDPLYIDEVEGEIESVKYRLTNITMYGLRNCTVTRLDMNATDNVWKQFLNCPKLISRFHFEVQENTDSPLLTGSGDAGVIAYDYDILNYGKYSVFVNEDHRPHFFVKTQYTKSLLKGKLVFAITKAYVVNTHRVNDTENYMNEHWNITEDFLHKPIINRAMKILIDHIDIYIRKYTMGQVLPEKNDN